MSDLDEFVLEFLGESREGLDRLDNDLVGLETDPQNAQLLDNIFRTLHTIKGNSGFFQFDALGAVAHAGETILGRLRSGNLILNSGITDALLAVVDALREQLKTVETTGSLGTKMYGDVIELAASLASSAESKPVVEKAERKRDESQEKLEDTIDYVKNEDASRTEDERAEREARTDRKDELRREDAPTESPSPSAAREAATPDTFKAPPADFEQTQAFIPTREMESLRGSADATLDPERTTSELSFDDDEFDDDLPPQSNVFTPSRQRSKPKSTHPPGSMSGSNIRVGIDVLDKLMNLVGELVLTRNQVLQFTDTQREPAFQNMSQRLNLITSELQEGIMQTRMQSIGSMWKKFPRMVRDLSKACGKRVTMDMFGTETELDKSLIETINDPLAHIIRNAIDHGIETPEERESKGKPKTGRLTLRAFHESGQVHIEIADDGAGMDTERVKQKAVQRGLFTAKQAEGLAPRVVLNSIFLPGFSTAEKITNVSGRGVGMDVVKTNIESIGGTVDIDSRLGNGTTIKIRIPLTLAIIPALIVTNRECRFAIPQINLLELLCLQRDEIRRDVERIGNAVVYRLRGKLLPLVSLTSELDLGDSATFDEQDEINIVVLQSNDRRFGLVVDEINTTEEIVVKPLGSLLQGIPVYAGVTIMGDGKVALILDVLGLARRAGVFNREHDHFIDQAEEAVAETRSTEEQLLICGIGGDRRLAIPLAQVLRLEEIPSSDIERSTGQEVVQHRGSLLSLIRMRQFVRGEVKRPERDPLQVVVYNHGEHSVGLVVDEIVDVVDHPAEIQTTHGRGDTVGAAVINGRVTDLLDMPNLLATANPTYFDSSPAVGVGHGVGQGGGHGVGQGGG